ncbi:apolipoprotein D-like [Lytechinus pictus]|uniref:apolipoprotein D-like n=1 Tax=Lytechinus pictus TaxID=7653 RepID=UPI0030B9FD38
MRMIVAFALLTLAACSSAQVIGFGGCPEIRAVEEFDFNRYQGRWFQIARFYNAPEEEVRCQSANFTQKDGYLVAQEQGVYGEEPYSYPIPIYRARDDESGRLYYASESDPGEFSVIYVDYERFSLIHICKEYLWGFINVQNNWITARQRRISEEGMARVHRVVTEMGINLTKFKRTDHEGCPRVEGEEEIDDGTGEGSDTVDEPVRQ